MNREEARQYIQDRATDYLQPDRSKKGYICPICGSGQGKNGTGFKAVLFGKEVSTQSEEDITPLINLMKKNNIPYSKIRFLKSCLEPCEDCKHGLSAHMCCNSSTLIRCLRILDKGTDCFTKKRQNGKIRGKRGA